MYLLSQGAITDAGARLEDKAIYVCVYFFFMYVFLLFLYFVTDSEWFMILGAHSSQQIMYFAQYVWHVVHEQQSIVYMCAQHMKAVKS